MSLVDIVFLRKEHIFDNAIHYVRHKSSQPLRITITEPLAALIAKYDNDSPYIFPILRDDAPFSHYDQYRSALARINRNLKRVGLKLGLTTPLTTYVARHTWRPWQNNAALRLQSSAKGWDMPRRKSRIFT